MTDGQDTQRRRLHKGGFAQGDIPEGFERMRSPHEDEPLTRRGKFIYYGLIAVLIVAGIVLILMLGGR